MKFKFFNVEAEYAKDKHLHKKDVQSLVCWTKEQPHLPEVNEAQVILFLKRWQHQPETTKKAMDTFFTMRTYCIDIFWKTNPLLPPFRDYINSILFAELSKTSQGYPIFLVKILDCSPDTFDYASIVKCFDMMLMLRLHQRSPSEGNIFVVDMGGLTLQLMSKFDYNVLIKYCYYFLNLAPIHFTELHLINVFPFLNKVLAIVRSFINFKLHSHSSLDELSKYVPLECLPRDYGGCDDTVEVLHDQMKRQLKENVDFFEWQEKQIVDESKRLGQFNDVIDTLEKQMIRKEKLVID